MPEGRRPQHFTGEAMKSDLIRYNEARNHYRDIDSKWPSASFGATTKCKPVYPAPARRGRNLCRRSQERVTSVFGLTTRDKCRWLCSALFAVVLLLSGSDRAFAYSPSRAFVAQCERELPPTRVEVQAVPTPIRYDFTKSAAVLTAQRSAGSGRTTTGLTVARWSTKLSASDSALVDRSGHGCIRPVVRIQLRLDEHSVYVAREFPRGTCSHNDTLEHEHEHVRINERQLLELAKSLQRDLRGHLGNRVFYGHVPALRANLKKSLRDDWLKRAQWRLEQGRDEHERFDREQQHGSARACPQERARLLRAVWTTR